MSLKDCFPVKYQNTAQSELVFDALSYALKAKDTDLLVRKFPENSFGCFYNRVFEDRDFVFIINGEWKFWSDKEYIISNWDWEKDSKEIIESYNGDESDIENYCDGWVYIDEGAYPSSLESYLEGENLDPTVAIDEKMVANSNPVYVDILELLQDTQTIEERALTILQQEGLSDLERVQQILALKK